MNRCPEYHKIDSIFLRDPATKHKTFLYGQYTRRSFEYLANLNWVFSEKIDGTNIRIHWDGETVTIGGRTDKAQIPPFLLDHLTNHFTAERMRHVFAEHGNTTLYGEGFGARIQKGGGNYIADGVDFALFDILKDGRWWGRAAVNDLGAALECRNVPEHAGGVWSGTLADAIELARNGFPSKIGTAQAEGLVCRPIVEMSDHHGRIITKVKTRDFSAENQT